MEIHDDAQISRFTARKLNAQLEAVAKKLRNITEVEFNIISKSPILTDASIPKNSIIINSESEASWKNSSPERVTLDQILSFPNESIQTSLNQSNDKLKILEII